MEWYKAARWNQCPDDNGANWQKLKTTPRCRHDRGMRPGLDPQFQYCAYRCGYALKVGILPGTPATP